MSFSLAISSSLSSPTSCISGTKRPHPVNSGANARSNKGAYCALNIGSPTAQSLDLIIVFNLGLQATTSHGRFTRVPHTATGGAALVAVAKPPDQPASLPVASPGGCPLSARRCQCPQHGTAPPPPPPYPPAVPHPL